MKEMLQKERLQAEKREKRSEHQASSVTSILDTSQTLISK